MKNALHQLTKSEMLDALDKHHAGEKEKLAEAHRQERARLLEFVDYGVIRTAD